MGHEDHAPKIMASIQSSQNNTPMLIVVAPYEIGSAFNVAQIWLVAWEAIDASEKRY